MNRRTVDRSLLAVRAGAVNAELALVGLGRRFKVTPGVKALHWWIRATDRVAYRPVDPHVVLPELRRVDAEHLLNKPTAEIAVKGGIKRVRYRP